MPTFSENHSSNFTNCVYSQMSLNFNLGSPLPINFYTGNIDPSISKTKLKAFTIHHRESL